MIDIAGIPLRERVDEILPDIRIGKYSNRFKLCKLKDPFQKGLTTIGSKRSNQTR